MRRRTGPPSHRPSRPAAVAAALAALVVTVVVGFVAPPAAAQEEGYLAVRAVDNGDPAEVDLHVTYSGAEADLRGAEISENGQAVEITRVRPLGEAGVEPAVVLAVDTAEGVDDVMAGIRRAATAVVDSLPPGTPIAVVTFSDGPLVVRGFTTDPAVATEAVGDLVSEGTTALWDGLLASAELLEEEAEGRQANVVLVTGSGDESSVTDFGRAAGALERTGAALWVAGMETGRYDPGAMQGLVARTGGLVLSTADTEAATGVGEQLAATMSGQYEVTYPRPGDEGAAAVGDVSVAVGGLGTELSYVPGSLSEGAAALAPQSAGASDTLPFLDSGMGKFVVLALVLVSVAMAAYAVILLFQRDEDALSAVLQPYAEGLDASPAGEDDDGGLATSAILQRAVDMTEEFAERQGLLARVEALLERADLPLRAAEALFFYAAAALITTVLTVVVTGNLLVGILVAGLVGILPSAIVNFKASRRRKKFEEQLPDTLQLLSGTLRAGYSLMQGVEAVSQEVEDPIGHELRRVVSEARLGRPLEEALDGAAERMDSPDFGWAVMAIGIQREVGGNLAELLLTVAETMTARERLRRDVAALTAEGKVSAIVLGLLPVGLSLAMWVVNPDYIGLLFTDPLGNIMLIGSVILAGVGFWWMKKTIEIEI